MVPYEVGFVFINKLIIRLFGYSVFAASERTDSPGKGNATIIFNFEWPNGPLSASPSPAYKTMDGSISMPDAARRRMRAGKGSVFLVIRTPTQKDPSYAICG